MTTPQEAYEIACKNVKPAYFAGTCIDYHGCWVFPYDSREGIYGQYVFVDKEDGTVFPFDPAFDISEFLKARNVGDQVSFKKEVMVHSLF